MIAIRFLDFIVAEDRDYLTVSDSELSPIASFTSDWAPSLVMIRDSSVWIVFTSFPLNLHHKGFLLELSQADING